MASCTKCHTIITRNNLIICSICKLNYDLQCANVSEKRFSLMTNENKLNWKCHDCIANFVSNVTIRRPTRVKSVSDISSILNSTLNISDSSANSAPNISVDYDQINELKHQIVELKIQLESAHAEIANLSLENHEIKEKLEDHERKLEMFRKATKTLNTLTPKRTNKCSSTYRNINVTPQNNTQNKPNLTDTDTTQIIKTNVMEIEANINTFNKSTNNANANNLLDNYTNIQRENPVTSNKNLKESTDTTTSTKTITTKTTQIKRKLYIISTDKRYNIEALEDTYGNNYDIFHFKNPNGGIKELLTNIEFRLKGFTMNDFCLILIGETDFQMTADYVHLVLLIQEKLQKLSHTNMVIGLPTFRLNTTFFNSRIETFNNLLYLNLSLHKNAYMFDTNLNLDYNYNMFTKYKGVINNTGIQCILQYSKECFEDIIYYNNSIYKENQDTIKQTEITKSTPINDKKQYKHFFR